MYKWFINDVMNARDTTFLYIVKSPGRKSTTGYWFKFGNGAISWKSKLQECTATWTTEAEYVVASDAVKEALWLSRLAHTFRQVDSDSAPIVYSDSYKMQQLQMTTNQALQKVTKSLYIVTHLGQLPFMLCT